MRKVFALSPVHVIAKPLINPPQMRLDQPVGTLIFGTDIHHKTQHLGVFCAKHHQLANGFAAQLLRGLRGGRGLGKFQPRVKLGKDKVRGRLPERIF